jgi:hypothetical protein
VQEGVGELDVKSGIFSANWFAVKEIL